MEWVAAADLELKDIARAADATELEDAAAGARQAHDGAPGPGEAHSSMPDPDTFAGMFAGAVDLSSLLSQVRVLRPCFKSRWQCVRGQLMVTD